MKDDIDLSKRKLFISDISIKRPVLATVVSIMMLIFGFFSLDKLSVREYPDIDKPIVSIKTVYKGAPSSIIESQITQVIEEAISGIEGIKLITSNSKEEVSSVSIEFNLSRKIDNAANDVRDKVAGIINKLPKNIDSPRVSKTDADARPFIWMGLSSDIWDSIELSDYAARYLVDNLSIVPGVAKVIIGGEKKPAMRIWLDRRSMSAYKITVDEIEEAIKSQNIELPSGRIESSLLEFSVKTDSGLVTVKQFENIFIKNTNNYLVRLKDIAEIKLGTEERRYEVRTNGKSAIGLGVVKQSKANELEISKGIRKKIREIEASLPKEVTLFFAYDKSRFVDASIKEVFKALAIAIILVILVIFIFLGNLRTTIIPAIVIPISLISSFTLLNLFGFSINVLTLLAYVLAVGLVVDDAIIVLENIYRRITINNEDVHTASINGTRQIGFAVIGTTLCLVAVFIPISLMSGNTGRLFGEFGIAVTGAVIFSSIIALSLTPMLCSKILVKNINEQKTNKYLDFFKKTYITILSKAIKLPLIVISILIFSLLISYTLYQNIKKEFSPTEDRGVFLVILNTPEGSTIQYTKKYLLETENILEPLTKKGSNEVNTVFGVLAPGLSRPSPVNFAIAFIILKPWKDRDRSQQEIVKELFPKLLAIPGANVFAINPPSLNQSGRKKPVQFVIGGPSYELLESWSTQIINEVKKNNPNFLSIDKDFKPTKPEIKVSINRNKAADIGVPISDIGKALETLFGSRIVSTFNDRGIQYNVIIQAKDQDRNTSQDLKDVYIKSKSSNKLISLDNLVVLTESASPKEFKRYNRMRSITITSSLSSNYTLGEALDYLENLAADILPTQARISFAGQSKEFKESSSSLELTFILALLIVFLALAALFESFISPLIIILTVPLAITGALITLYCTGNSLNIYSQIGMIMLVGLVAKNAIIIVEFANQLRGRGRSINEAILESSLKRARPVLMTTIATVLGALPLVLASGAGSESRAAIGWVIFGGVSSSTLLTLIITPCIYTLLISLGKKQKD